MSSVGSMNVFDEAAVLLESPSHIIFRGPFNRPVSSTLRLVNSSESKVIFKLKTSAPNYYGVRPNFGVVHPKNFVEVEIVRVAFVYDSKKIKCERFLVQSMVVPDHIENINEYWKTANPVSVNSWKIRCVFEIPKSENVKEPIFLPSTAMEEIKTRSNSEEEVEQKRNVLLRSELENLINENENLRNKKIDLMQEIERLSVLDQMPKRRVGTMRKPTKVELLWVDYLMVSITFAVVCILIGKFML